MDDYKKIAKSDINLKKGKVVDVIEKRECGEYIKYILLRIFVLLSNHCRSHNEPRAQVV